MTATRDYSSILRSAYRAREAALYFEKAQEAEKVNNVPEAVKYFKYAADLGHMLAQFSLGVLYYTLEMNEESFRYFCLAAQQGSLEAGYNVAACYNKAVGVKYSPFTSYKYLKQLSKKGFAEAQYKMGEAYLKGRCVCKNYNTAIHYYTLAAQQGNKQAIYHLGRCKLLGLGSPIDRKEAFKYFKQASPRVYKNIPEEWLDDHDTNEVSNRVSTKKRKICWLE